MLDDLQQINIFLGRAYTPFTTVIKGQARLCSGLQIIIIIIQINIFFEEEGGNSFILNLGIYLSLESGPLLLPRHFLDISPSPFPLLLVLYIEGSKSLGIIEVLMEARQEWSREWSLSSLFDAPQSLDCGRNLHLKKNSCCFVLVRHANNTHFNVSNQTDLNK